MWNTPQPQWNRGNQSNQANNGNPCNNNGNRDNYHNVPLPQLLPPRGGKRDQYPLLPVTLADMFIKLESAKAIELPPTKPETPNCDQNKYCPFHRRHGHNIDDCWTFRDAVYDMVEADVFEWDVLVKKSQTEGANRGILANLQRPPP